MGLGVGILTATLYFSLGRGYIGCGYLFRYQLCHSFGVYLLSVGVSVTTISRKDCDVRGLTNTVYNSVVEDR
jgi:hypothetical protein